jgi:GDP-D-mannose 3', 5'-epimerase
MGGFMVKILITGGGGFIGSHLAKYLYDKGNFVRVADIKFANYFKDYYHEKRYLDLREINNCYAAVAGMDYV